MHGGDAHEQLGEADETQAARARHGLDGTTGADGQPAALLSAWRMQACRLRGCACKCAVGAVLRVGPSQAGELAGAVRKLRALRRSRLKSLRLLISLTSTPTLLIAIERDWQQ